MKLLICNLLHHILTSSLLGRNIPLSTSFSNTLKLCSSLSEATFRTHTTSEVIVLYRFLGDYEELSMWEYQGWIDFQPAYLFRALFLNL
jgi:hypothetical protein